MNDLIDELLDHAASAGAALARATDGTPILNVPASLDPELKDMLRRYQPEISARIAARISEYKAVRAEPATAPASEPVAAQPSDRVPRTINTAPRSQQKPAKPSSRKPATRPNARPQPARRHPVQPKPTVFDKALTGLIYSGLPLAALAYAGIFLIH